VDYQLKGKLAVFTAGAHGIGEAIADRLTEEGVQVIVADCDAGVLREKSRKWRSSNSARFRHSHQQLWCRRLHPVRADYRRKMGVVDRSESNGDGTDVPRARSQ